MADLMQVSGLWKNTSANGEMYLQGKMGSVRILVFKNKYKTADNQPDYQMYFAPVERRENEGAQGDDFVGGEDFEGGDPAFQEGQSAHTQQQQAAAPRPAAMERGASVAAPARQYATANDALLDSPPQGFQHYDRQGSNPNPPGARRPQSTAPRSAPAPARRPAPPATDYDDMGDLADPFAE